MTENIEHMARRTQSAVAAIIAAVVLMLIGVLSGAWPITASAGIVLIGAIVVLGVQRHRP